jgi:tetratricopeptide (TPR) repeat protein
LDIITKLASTDPSNTGWQGNLSISYDGIGNVQRGQGDLKTAMESYHKALDIITKLTSSDPSNTGWQRDLSESYDNIGDVQRAQGDLKAAMESYHKALEISAKLAALDGTNAEWQADLAYSHWAMAYLFGTLPNTDTRQSASECKLALEILRPLAEENRLTADQADWVPEIQTLLLSLTAPQKVPNKPPKRNP